MSTYIFMVVVQFSKKNCGCHTNLLLTSPAIGNIIDCGHSCCHPDPPWVKATLSKTIQPVCEPMAPSCTNAVASLPYGIPLMDRFDSRTPHWPGYSCLRTIGQSDTLPPIPPAFPFSFTYLWPEGSPATLPSSTLVFIVLSPLSLLHT